MFGIFDIVVENCIEVKKSFNLMILPILIIAIFHEIKAEFI